MRNTKRQPFRQTRRRCAKYPPFPSNTNRRRKYHSPTTNFSSSSQLHQNSLFTNPNSAKSNLLDCLRLSLGSRKNRRKTFGQNISTIANTKPRCKKLNLAAKNSEFDYWYENRFTTNPGVQQANVSTIGPNNYPAYGNLALNATNDRYYHSDQYHSVQIGGTIKSTEGPPLSSSPLALPSPKEGPPFNQGQPASGNPLTNQSLNLKHFSLAIVTLLLFICVFCSIKLLACLQNPRCGLRLDAHYLLALLILSLLLTCYLIYQIMLLLSSFWEKFSFNLHNKGSQQQQRCHQMAASKSAGQIQFNMQSIALVSNYFQVERPQPKSIQSANSTPIPSINFQLVDAMDAAHQHQSAIVKEYRQQSPVRIKKLSICSIEMASEFLAKYGSNEWLQQNGLLSATSASSSESVSTEKSDYYLELPGGGGRDGRGWQSASPSPPSSPLLLTKSASLRMAISPRHGHNINRNLSVY